MLSLYVSAGDRVSSPPLDGLDAAVPRDAAALTPWCRTAMAGRRAVSQSLAVTLCGHCSLGLR